MTKDVCLLFLSPADTCRSLEDRGLAVAARELAEELPERLWALEPGQRLVVADWFGAGFPTDAADRFVRAGWEVLAPRAEREAIARRSRNWIVVSGAENVLEPFRIAARHLVWLHAEAAPRNARLADRAWDLARVLGLERRTVALLVDLENVATSMRERHLPFYPRELALRLVRAARLRGDLVEAAALADWSRLPPAVTASGDAARAVDAMRELARNGIEPVFVLGKPGHNSADIALLERAHRLLRSPDRPGRLVVVSGDADFLALAEEAARLGVATEFWSFRGSASQRLAEIAEVRWLDEMLDLRGREEAPGVEREPERSADNRLVAAVLHGLLVRNGWSYASFKWLQKALEGRGHLAEGPDAARQVIERAAAEGAVRLEVVRRHDDHDRVFQEHRIAPAAGTRLWRELLLIARVAEEHAARLWERSGSAPPVQLVRELLADPDLAGVGIELDEQGAWSWLDLLLTAQILERVILPDPAQPGTRAVAVLPPRQAREARTLLARSRSAGPSRELLTVPRAAEVILLSMQVNPILPRAGFAPLRDLLNRVVRGIGLPRPLFDQALDHLCATGVVRIATFPAEGGRRHDVKGLVPLQDHPDNLRAQAVMERILEALVQGRLSRSDLETLLDAEDAVHPDTVVAVLLQHGIASTAQDDDDLLPNPSHPLIARPESTS